jgi:uncharacterized protein (TIGR03067 family)
MLFPLLLLIAALGFAPAPVFRERPDDPVAVLKRLQGTWTVPRYELGGRTAYSKGEAYTIEIEKDRWTFFRSVNGSPLVKLSSHTLKLDPKATPAEIDLIATHDPMFIFSGVYELKGDTPKFVFRTDTHGKKNRAKDIINPGPGTFFMQLERRP